MFKKFRYYIRYGIPGMKIMLKAMENHDINALVHKDFFHIMTEVYRNAFPLNAFPFRMSLQVYCKAKILELCIQTNLWVVPMGKNNLNHNLSYFITNHIAYETYVYDFLGNW